MPLRGQVVKFWISQFLSNPMLCSWKLGKYNQEVRTAATCEYDFLVLTW